VRRWQRNDGGVAEALAVIRKGASRIVQVTLSPEPRLLQVIEEALRSSGVEVRVAEVESRFPATHRPRRSDGS
jgi:hypothetical protein